MQGGISKGDIVETVCGNSRGQLKKKWNFKGLSQNLVEFSKEGRQLVFSGISLGYYIRVKKVTCKSKNSWRGLSEKYTVFNLILFRFFLK